MCVRQALHSVSQQAWRQRVTQDNAMRYSQPQQDAGEVKVAPEFKSLCWGKGLCGGNGDCPRAIPAIAVRLFVHCTTAAEEMVGQIQMLLTCQWSLLQL